MEKRLGVGEFNDAIKCIDGDNVYYVPRDIFARVVMGVKIQGKRFIRYKTGAEMYDMSERQFKTISSDAKAICKINRMVMVDVEKLEKYLAYFMNR